MTTKNKKTNAKKTDLGAEQVLAEPTITEEIIEDQESIASNDKAPDTDSQFVTLLVGSAPKLSAKSSGSVGFELALNTEDECRYIRLTSNDSGGLFSKEWVNLDAIYTLLESMAIDKPFKSSVFKAVIKGGSANNVSFLSAVLRGEEVALIIKSEKSQFLHLVNPILSNRIEHLAKLKPLDKAS